MHQNGQGSRPEEWLKSEDNVWLWKEMKMHRWIFNFRWLQNNRSYWEEMDEIHGHQVRKSVNSYKYDDPSTKLLVPISEILILLFDFFNIALNSANQIVALKQSSISFSDAETNNSIMLYKFGYSIKISKSYVNNHNILEQETLWDKHNAINLNKSIRMELIVRSIKDQHRSGIDKRNDGICFLCEWFDDKSESISVW